VADVTLTQKRDVYILENEKIKVEIDASAGARITSWTIKESGRNIVALWKGAKEIGGLLDDRAFFTAASYEVATLKDSPEQVTLRFTARHPGGLGIEKQVTLSKESQGVDVYYQYENGTQAPQRLWVRNFPVPGNHPQTEAHVYWVSGKNERGQSPQGTPDAHNRYDAVEPFHAVQWDSETGDGIMVVAPGVEKFYFWRGSKEFPTFEWYYAEIPAGKLLTAQVTLTTISQKTPTPDWSALAQEQMKKIPKPRLLALKGWVDEATKFGISDTQRAKGLWLSTGTQEGKQPLTGALPLDIPRNDDRYVFVTVNALKDISGNLKVDVPDAWRQNVTPFLETPASIRIELLPIPEKPVTFKAGESNHIWLKVSTAGKPAGAHKIPVTIAVGDITESVGVELHIWPVDAPRERIFHLRGYCGGFPVWTGGHEVTEKGLRQLETILKAFTEMGGDVIDWNAAWHAILPHVTLAETGEKLTEVAKANPERIALDKLPNLDFSYFDPWFEVAKRYGVTRVETYMAYPTDPSWQGRLLGPALGKGRMKVGTPEAEADIVWYYQQMRKYFEAKGFSGFFCKISDEISPEHIPQHIETAKVVRKAGWRPFTTITGMIARTAENIKEMNPYCDEWQLSFGLKDDFLKLTTEGFTLKEETIDLKGKWGPYGNGGAEKTWAMKVFGEGSFTGIDAGKVESLELLEDGRALPFAGGSPWGNKERGIAFTAGALQTHLYVSPRDGEDPAKHRYELRLKLRTASAGAKPLVSIDPTDEVWCYGDSSRPYRMSYGASWVYPIMTLYHGFKGYGQWAFYHWNQTERIMWFDPETFDVTVSPAYCGFRDGFRDALLFKEVEKKRGKDALSKLLSESDTAILRVGSRTHEVYNFRTVTNAESPLNLNTARREALRLLSGDKP